MPGPVRALADAASGRPRSASSSTRTSGFVFRHVGSLRSVCRGRSALLLPALRCAPCRASYERSLARFWSSSLRFVLHACVGLLLPPRRLLAAVLGSGRSKSTAPPAGTGFRQIGGALSGCGLCCGVGCFRLATCP